MIKLVLMLAFILTMTGCSYLPQAVSTLEKVHDAKLDAAEKAYCNGVSEAAVYRRYGLNSKKAIARRVLCGFSGGGSIAE